jgi:hypothetical protein
MQKYAPLKVFLGNGRTSVSGFQTPKWMALFLAALLGLTATTVQGRLEVVNGDFSDLTGLTPGNDGWYSGMPKGWTGSDGTYAVNSKNGATPPICNPSQLGRLRQQVGTLEKTADVVLTFDVSDVFNGETVLKASHSGRCAESARER